MKNHIAKRIAAAEDYVNATPEQRTVIDQAKDNIIAAFEQRMQAHQGEGQQWIALLTSDKLDAQAIIDRADKHADEIRAMARQLAPELVKVHDVLTPAQRQKLAERAKELHARHHGPAQGGFGGPSESGK
jgi:Spy/CpxP family protein refolding chaperone